MKERRTWPYRNLVYLRLEVMNPTLILMTLVHYDLLVVYEERVLGRFRCVGTKVKCSIASLEELVSYPERL
jgi:hypothetical protein